MIERTRYISFLIIVLLFALTACSDKHTISEKTKLGYGGAEMFVEKELSDEIEACIKAKDVQRIKALFSDFALENESLDKDLEDFYNLFPKDFEAKYRMSDYRSEDLGGTNIRRIYTGRIHYTSEGQTYRVVFVWIKSDPEHPERQGIHSIQLIDQKSKETDKYRIHSENDEPGVYVYTVR
ncbi:MAG: DUF5104 domain-containing protein [Eubacterium sp.]|nr:DUF5104 domain-containing protein [Eubacterium sp.]